MSESEAVPGIVSQRNVTSGFCGILITKTTEMLLSFLLPLPVLSSSLPLLAVALCQSPSSFLLRFIYLFALLLQISFDFGVKWNINSPVFISIHKNIKALLYLCLRLPLYLFSSSFFLSHTFQVPLISALVRSNAHRCFRGFSRPAEAPIRTRTPQTDTLKLNPHREREGWSPHNTSNNTTQTHKLLTL